MKGMWDFYFIQGQDGRIPDQKRVEERGIWLLHGCDSQPVPAQEWEEERGDVLRSQTGLPCSGAQVAHCTRDK